MKYGNHKVLNHKPTLYRMVNLRLNGLSMVSLGSLFGVDWTTIRHHCQIYKIPKPEQSYNIQAIIAQLIPKAPKVTYKIVNGEKINLGRSYKDYF